MSGAISSASNFDSVMSKLGVTRPGATTAAAAKANDTLDQSAFLKLMTTQLKNQDPFKPVENTEMVAQMAQMSQVSGIAEMNQSLKALADRMGTSENAAAMSYVGRTVQVEGNTAYPGQDGSIDLQVPLDRSATGLLVSITDASGAPVRTLQLGAQAAGTADVHWDGKDDNGGAVGGGPFKVRVVAQRGDGATEVKPLVWAPVTSVRVETGQSPKLSVAGLGDIPISAVRQVG